MDALTLATIRQGKASVMTDTCTISRSVVSDDGGGAPRVTSTTTATSRCLFSAASARGTQQGDTVEKRGSYRLQLPWGTDIQSSDTITFNGRVFTIVWLSPDITNDACRIVGLEERAL